MANKNMSLPLTSAGPLFPSECFLVFVSPCRRLLGIITKKDILRHMAQMANQDPESIMFNWSVPSRMAGGGGVKVVMRRMRRRRWCASWTAPTSDTWTPLFHVFNLPPSLTDWLRPSETPTGGGTIIQLLRTNTDLRNAPLQATDTPPPPAHTSDMHAVSTNTHTWPRPTCKATPIDTRHMCLLFLNVFTEVGVKGQNEPPPQYHQDALLGLQKEEKKHILFTCVRMSLCVAPPHSRQVAMATEKTCSHCFRTHSCSVMAYVCGTEEIQAAFQEQKKKKSSQSDGKKWEKKFVFICEPRDGCVCFLSVWGWLRNEEVPGFYCTVRRKRCFLLPFFTCWIHFCLKDLSSLPFHPPFF